MQEEHLKQLSALLVSLARIRTGIRNDFLVGKLDTTILRLVNGFTRLLAESSVAQYITLREIKTAFDELVNTLEYLEYFQAGMTTPLLQSQVELHMFYKAVLKDQKRIRSKGKFRLLKGEKESKQSEQKLIQNHSLSHNQKKILTFIASVPNARTKDIIDEFSSLSGRTVKRSLRELMEVGLITKRAEHKAVYYSASSRRD